MMGANHIRVRYALMVSPGWAVSKVKIKKKVWIREGDILIVVPWSFQDDKCDIIYRYTGPQVEWLISETGIYNTVFSKKASIRVTL